MALPAPGNSISANMINVEAQRSGTANAPLSGSSSTPQAGSLVKLYAPPNSDVDQNAPHAYSEFYSKSWSSRDVKYYQRYYYGTTTPFSSVFDACGSSSWLCTGLNTFYYSGTLGNGTVCYDAASGNTLKFASAVTTPLSLKESRTGASTHTCNINSSSEVTNYAACPSLTAFDSSPETNAVGSCTQTIYSNTWYHTGTDTYPKAGDWVFQNNGNYDPVVTTGGEWFKSQQGARAYRLQNATPGPGYCNSDNGC
tara:strand:+ start:40 stop:801 length:762 start_codon:yes stop_codon:yes gene_type:complete